jgi:hypothetical protein
LPTDIVTVSDDGERAQDVRMQARRDRAPRHSLDRLVRGFLGRPRKCWRNRE